VAMDFNVIVNVRAAVFPLGKLVIGGLEELHRQARTRNPHLRAGRRFDRARVSYRCR
jgi:hypothetical protein